MSLSNEFPTRFKNAYQTVENLADQNRYTGAFVFGSVARGDYTDKSDFDVKVVVDQHNPCRNINHPIINGVKLDISFQSFDQLKAFTEQEIERAERIPMIAESIIIFDKTGDLAELKQEALDAKPKKATPEDYQLIQFMIYHANDKAQRYLEDDPQSALLSMGINVNDLIKNHYQLQGKWWVSNKRLLPDLREWDPQLATLLGDFALTANVTTKFGIWNEIIDHVLKPIGGRQPISENNCDCNVCKNDLSNFPDAQHTIKKRTK